MRSVRRAALGLGILAVVACAPSPEDLARETVEGARVAVETGTIGDLSRFVADAYRGADGRTKDELVELVAEYASERRPLHLLVVERRLGRIASGEIEAELVVAAASVPIESLFDASRASADVGIVTARLVEEAPAEWRIAWADWRPASVTDFLPGR